MTKLLHANCLQNDTTYFGATVGRVANRIGGAQFTINGTHYKLVANEGNNTLHGMFNISGKIPIHIYLSCRIVFLPKCSVCPVYLLGGSRGFSDVLWKVERYQKEGPSPRITFSYHSFDGEEGQPLYHSFHCFEMIKVKDQKSEQFILEV